MTTCFGFGTVRPGPAELAGLEYRHIGIGHLCPDFLRMLALMVGELAEQLLELGIVVLLHLIGEHPVALHGLDLDLIGVGEKIADIGHGVHSTNASSRSAISALAVPISG